jgi:exosortase
LAEAKTAKAAAVRRTLSLDGRPVWDWNRVLTPRAVLLMIPVAAMVLWIYPYWCPGPRGDWEVVWRQDTASWGHGYLIPFLAVLIAHFRLTENPPTRLAPSAWGLVLILAGLVLRIAFQTLMFHYAFYLTFLLVVGGVIWLLLGWQVLKTLIVPVLYLGMMIPWDQKYYEQVALPLQTVAAVAAKNILSMGGMVIGLEGNVLHPKGSPPVGVAGACSGLHLLVTFVALGVLMAYCYRRPFWERVVMMVSSVPIAVLCNILRVSLMTASGHAVYLEAGAVGQGAPTWSASLPDAFWNLFPGPDLAARLLAFYESIMNPASFLHQSFGFAMLGLAFVLIWVEIKMIDMVFVDEDDAATPGARAPARTARR